VVAGLLAACDDDPRPRIGPPESTSPAPTDPSSSTPESLGPKETVRAWVEARNYALNTGDVAQVRDLSAASCETCTDLIDPIAEVYKEGGRFETEGWTIASSNVSKQKGRRAEVQVALDVAGGRTTESAGAKPVEYPPEKRIAVFKLNRIEKAWRVSFLGFLS